ncbi:hypothetical protein Tco_0943812 [Tanacetum coccineum]
MQTKTELTLEQTQQGRNWVNTYAIRSTKLLSGIEDSHHGPSDEMHNPPYLLKVSQKTLVSFLMEITRISIDSLNLTSNILRVLRIILVILPENQSDTKVFTMTIEILPEPTSNKLCGSWYQEPKFLIQMSPKRSKGEESKYPFVEGDGSSSDEWGDYGVAGDDYEGPPVFYDDQYGEESMPVYDTDIEDVIEEEEGYVGKGGFGEEEDNIEDVVVVANDLCFSMIKTTLNFDFEEDLNTKSHELMSFGKKYYYQG